MNPCFAIIDSNTLSSMSLRSILWDIYNHVEVLTYNSMEAFIRDSNRHFVHFFVSSDILFNNADEFETLKKQTIVLTVGAGSNLEAAGFRTLDVSQPEQELVSRLLHIHSIGHGEAYGKRKKAGVKKGLAGMVDVKDVLSAREKDVLELMVKGLINKEIADRLGISTTTVIFHRNNLCEKLQTRSIGRLTIYAVLSGIVDINEI